MTNPTPFSQSDMYPDFTEVSDRSLLSTEPLVSVVVVTFRHASYLAEAIESIVAQITDFPFEIIVAEDNSPDDTRNVALGLQRKYPHLVRLVFTPENKGGTRNSLFAFGFCRAAFVAVCEGDDFWIDDRKLARQVAALQQRPGVDLAFTRGYRLYADGTRVADWDYGETERIIHTSELVGTWGFIAPTASLVFRAHLLQNLPNWYENCPFCDTLLIMAGSIRGGAYYEPSKTVCYRIAQPTSFTVQLLQAPAREKIEFLDRAIRLMPAACAHYQIPHRYLSHRTNDYRLSRGKLQLREGLWVAGMKTLITIDPMFLARGVGRRLKRVVSRLTAG